MRDINTAVVDSLKVLDPNRPIREAEVRRALLSYPAHAGYPVIQVLVARNAGVYWITRLRG